MESSVEEDVELIASISNVDSVSDLVDSGIGKGPSHRTKLDICRTCLVEAATMRSLFQEDGISSAAHRLMALTHVKMMPDDGLPSQICRQCIIKLDLSYNFKLLVEQSDTALKLQLSSFDVKEESCFEVIDNFTDNKSCNEIYETDIEELEKEKYDEKEKNHIDSVENLEVQELQGINDKVEVQHHEVQEIVTDQNNENNQSIEDLQEIMLNEINDREKLQEKLNGLHHIAMHEHDYIKSQSCENLEDIMQDEVRKDIEKEIINQQDKSDDTKEESVLHESIHRSKHKLIQESSEQHMSSDDEENYFENLNLSSRLKKIQSEKSEKVLFICYWCDKQFSSREILREHMYSHEEIRKTLPLVRKSPDKSNKTLEKSTATATPVVENFGISGRQPNTCPHCGKEYLYIISYKKHLKQHAQEKKASQDDSVPLEISVHEDEESLDFHNYDDNYSADSDNENKEMNNENEIKNSQKQASKEEIPSDNKVNATDVNILKLRKKPIPSGNLNEVNTINENVISESEIVTNSIDDIEHDSKLKENNEPTQKVESIKKHKCPHCLQVFKHEIGLTLHMKIHHKNDITGREVEKTVNTRRQSYPCNECNKNFGNELTLRNHLIATGHKTTIQGEKYDLSKRIKRVAAKEALKVIDKIQTDLSSEESDGDKFENNVKDLDFNQAKEKHNTKQTEHVTSKSKKVQSKVLFCETCNIKCLSKQSLANHMELHAKSENLIKHEKPEIDEIEDDDDYEGGIDDWPMDSYECPTCKKKYSTKKSMLRHQLLHEEPNFECDICNVKFYRKDKLKAHYDKCSERNPDQVRKCNICGDMFENNEILKDHRAKHVADGILTEEDLMEIDPKPEDKSEGTPRKRRTDIVGLECTECNKQYTSRKGLLRHLQVHEGKKFLCDICPKKFYRREHLKIHVAKHNITKPYKCHKCAKRFLKEELLNNHMLRHERIMKKPKEPSTENPKRFLCEICPKSFTQSTTLVAHLRAHKGIKPFVCEVCSRPFTTNAYLKMHMRTHTQEKPYICQYCSRAFGRADTLANHLTSHTGEAKYHCKSCPKHFRRLKSLKEHIFVHTGQRPYSCPTCDRKFNNNGSRYAHSKRCKQNQQQQRAQAQIIDNNVEQLDTQILLTTTEEHGEHQQIEQEVQMIEQEVEPLQLVEHEVAPLQLVEQDDLQGAQVTQHQVMQRIGMVTTSTGQFIKPQSIKTITIARPVDGTLGQQHVMGQEILMPLILPFAVTYSDVGDEVILSENSKIFTT